MLLLVCGRSSFALPLPHRSRIYDRVFLFFNFFIYIFLIRDRLRKHVNTRKRRVCARQRCVYCANNSEFSAPSEFIVFTTWFLYFFWTRRTSGDDAAGGSRWPAMTQPCPRTDSRASAVSTPACLQCLIFDACLLLCASARTVGQIESRD